MGSSFGTPAASTPPRPPSVRVLQTRRSLHTSYTPARRRLVPGTSPAPDSCLAPSRRGGPVEGEEAGEEARGGAGFAGEVGGAGDEDDVPAVGGGAGRGERRGGVGGDA